MNPSDPISDHFRINRAQADGLRKLGITTLEDLLFHFPSRYGDIARISSISGLQPGTNAQVYGRVKSIDTKKSYRGGIPMAEAVIEDDTGTVKAVWFNQPYIAKMIKQDALVRMEGQPSEYKERISFQNPEIEPISSIPAGLPTSPGADETLFQEDLETYAQPIYPEARGITSRWLYHAVGRVLADGVHRRLTDAIPAEIRTRYSLPEQSTALVWIHTPRKHEHAESARKRFAFEEVFAIQLAKQQARASYEAYPSFRIHYDMNDLAPFLKRFSFTPTDAQHRSIDQILTDMTGESAMSRLLEGDVGSGKTLVAAATAYAVVHTRPHDKHDFGTLQVAYMAPTEVLARQHFASFIEMFGGLNIPIGLITSSGCRVFPSKVDPHASTNISRRQLLKWVANGEIPILIGTHSLIQDSVAFENLGYVIVDEQHRFGTNQRKRLRSKDDIMPHLLSMTATPIPRTLALTIYGDLDISLLDEQPAGRKQVETTLAKEEERDTVYTRVREELEHGRQAYVIVPRIEPPDPANENAFSGASVTDMQSFLQHKIFSDYTVEGLHSRMTPKEKNAVMERFVSGEIDVLVSTAVVEVGVSVANATAMIIENAERFGLAQLHQFRGRIMRSTHQPYCFVFSEAGLPAQAGTKKTTQRLKALRDAKNGFELAEHDLAQRGAGELAGARQSGVSDIGMEAIRNIKMVEVARTEARKLIEHDPELREFPALHKKITHADAVHFE